MQARYFVGKYIEVGKYQGARKIKRYDDDIRVGKYIEVGKYQGVRKIKRYYDKCG